MKQARARKAEIARRTLLPLDARPPVTDFGQKDFQKEAGEAITNPEARTHSHDRDCQEPARGQAAKT